MIFDVNIKFFFQRKEDWCLLSVDPRMISGEWSESDQLWVTDDEVKSY